MPDIRVATSGWMYDHWRGRFYPEKLPKTRWFEHYVSVFDTVELNNTFYATPRETTVMKWYETTPDGFVFAVKGARYISHVKRLGPVQESLDRQDAPLVHLKEKLGPILWQLPEKWALDLERLEQFLKLRPSKQRWCFEFRSQSCFCPEVYKLLRRYKAALVWADTPHYPFAAEVTADFLYARLHGHEEFYVSRYTDEQLAWWRDLLIESGEGERDLFVYFDNDAHGHAPRDALRLRELLRAAL